MAATFADIVHGCATFVLGSAPTAGIPSSQCSLKLGRLVACNGGIAPFPGLVPDILVINSYTVLRKDKVGPASMDASRGGRARHLVLITSSMTFDAMRASCRRPA